MSTLLALLSELEKHFISQRTKEALRVCKSVGVKLGRPKEPGKSKLDQYREEIIALLKNGSTKAYVAKKYNVARPNLHSWLKKNNKDSKPDLQFILLSQDWAKLRSMEYISTKV